MSWPSLLAGNYFLDDNACPWAGPIIPIPFMEKGPVGTGWEQTTRLQGQQCRDGWFGQRPMNLGMVLGGMAGIVDIDCDCQWACDLADIWLPRTLTFGRASRRRSHRFYIGRSGSKQFKDPTDKKMLIEIRSNKANGEVGLQTVLPGSTHPSGELVEFEPDSLPAPVVVDVVDLYRRVAIIASMSLVAKHWPESGRHETQLGLAGVLVKT